MIGNIIDIKINKNLRDNTLENFENVSVIGCGIMGSGIAQSIAYSEKYYVSVMDENENMLKASYEKMSKSLAKIISKEQKIDNEEKIAAKVHSIMNRISFYTDLKPSLESSNLIIEAIPEKLSLKRELYSKISSYLGPNTILVTNTSSLSVKELSLAVKNNENFAGLHFFNPVALMKLVEVVYTTSTSATTLERLIKFCDDIKKVPIKCRDSPGFIVNHILIPMIVKACALVESDTATPKDIDLAMKLGASHPMGPLELADYIGLDTVKYILDSLGESYPLEKDYKCPKIIETLVAEGKLGRKTGQGFHKY